MACSTPSDDEQTTGPSEDTGMLATGGSGSEASSADEGTGMPTTDGPGAECVDVLDCELPCENEECQAQGLSAACWAGECWTFYNCTPDVNAPPPPECPDGQQAVDGSASWTGECVDANQCGSVPDCTYCAADDVCVTTQIVPGVPDAEPYEVSACRLRPTQCDGDTDCECFCDLDPGASCLSADDSGVTCTRAEA